MLDTLLRILALIRKEFLALLKDRRSRTVVIIPPLLQTLIFGYAATFDVSSVPCAIFDEDNSKASRDLAARLAGAPTFKVVLRATSMEAVTEALTNGDILLALRMPQGMERGMYGGGAQVQVIVDGRNSNTGMLALNYAGNIIESYSAAWMQEQGYSGPPAVLVTRAWYNPNLLSRWFFVPGLLAMVTLVVTMVVTALSVAREREQGTFDQLLVAPYRPIEILIGKAVPGYVIGLTGGTVALLVACFWFAIPLRGSVLTLYAGLLLFLFSVVGLGLMISSMAATMQQGLLGTFLFITPAVILSGFATPIANMTEIVQWLTLINPLRYVLVIIRAVFLEGAGLGVLWSQLWPLAVIGLVTMSVANWLFRRRIY